MSACKAQKLTGSSQIKLLIITDKAPQLILVLRPFAVTSLVVSQEYRLASFGQELLSAFPRLERWSLGSPPRRLSRQTGDVGCLLIVAFRGLSRGELIGK